MRGCVHSVNSALSDDLFHVGILSEDIEYIEIAFIIGLPEDLLSTLFGLDGNRSHSLNFKHQTCKVGSFVIKAVKSAGGA